MPLIAITICLVGVMDLQSRPFYENKQWEEDFKEVSGFYGPGAALSWFALALSMLYDANQEAKTRNKWFHVGKYLFVCGPSLIALGDSTYRALHLDFGPKYAAAAYMSDKGFELGALLYTLIYFPITRKVNKQGAHASPQASDIESAPHT